MRREMVRMVPWWSILLALIAGAAIGILMIALVSLDR